jgi:hypothetical protein
MLKLRESAHSPFSYRPPRGTAAWSSARLVDSPEVLLVTSFVLIPGAGGAAWYWHRVVPLLTAAGHEAIPVDLPGDDETAGLPEYTDIVAQAIGNRTDVVLVASSLGAFTAPLVAQRVPVRGIVLVNAMIPLPGETAGAWWDNTGAQQAPFADVHPQASDLLRTHALPRLRRVFAAAIAAPRVWPVRQEPGTRPTVIPENTDRGVRRARAVVTAGLAARQVSIVA